MEEAVRAFVAARLPALRLARAAATASTALVSGTTRNSKSVSKSSVSRRRSGNKRTLGQADLEETGESSPRKTRATTRASSKEAATLIVVDDSETEAQETETELEETPPGRCHWSRDDYELTTTQTTALWRVQFARSACPKSASSVTSTLVAAMLRLLDLLVRCYLSGESGS